MCWLSSAAVLPRPFYPSHPALGSDISGETLESEQQFVSFCSLWAWQQPPCVSLVSVSTHFLSHGLCSVIYSCPPHTHMVHILLSCCSTQHKHEGSVSVFHQACLLPLHVTRLHVFWGGNGKATMLLCGVFGSCGHRSAEIGAIRCREQSAAVRDGLEFNPNVQKLCVQKSGVHFVMSLHRKLGTASTGQLLTLSSNRPAHKGCTPPLHVPSTLLFAPMLVLL